VKDSGVFDLEPPLDEDKGILIFRHVDHIALGRALSDQDKHEQAISELEKATSLDPANVEAWANLALAYERYGRMDKTVEAANQALLLNPNHYWVNYILALAFYNQKQWSESIKYAEYATINAPNTQERVN